jgi:hypothetical protein
MRLLRSPGFALVSLALAFALMGSPGCGKNKTSNPTATDEGLIRSAIDAWLTYLDRGEQPGPVDLYDAAAWDASPAKTEWQKYAGRTPAASDISISIAQTTASATFTVTTDDQEQFQVTWELHKVGSDWLISSETWT